MIDNLPSDWQRLIIWGAAGAGKSTLARVLASARQAQTGVPVPVIHMDKVFLRADRSHVPHDQARDAMHPMLAGKTWIVEGNYGAALDLLLEHADTALYIDCHRWLSLYRVMRRQMTTPDGGDDMPAGWRHELPLHFINFILRIAPRDLRQQKARMEAGLPKGRVITLPVRQLRQNSGSP